jgi:hypothetical protein
MKNIETRILYRGTYVMFLVKVTIHKPTKYPISIDKITTSTSLVISPSPHSVSSKLVLQPLLYKRSKGDTEQIGLASFGRNERYSSVKFQNLPSPLTLENIVENGPPEQKGY